MKIQPNSFLGRASPLGFATRRPTVVAALVVLLQWDWWSWWCPQVGYQGSTLGCTRILQDSGLRVTLRTLRSEHALIYFGLYTWYICIHILNFSLFFLSDLAGNYLSSSPADSLNNDFSHLPPHNTTLSAPTQPHPNTLLIHRTWTFLLLLTNFLSWESQHRKTPKIDKISCKSAISLLNLAKNSTKMEKNSHGCSMLLQWVAHISLKI